MTSYEPGLYQNVPVVAQGFGESKDKHTPGFFLKIKPGDYEREIWWYLPDGKEDAIDRLMSGLETLGFDGSSFAELDPASPKFWDFTQTTITAECRHEAYNGKQVERWQLPFSGVAREVAPLDPKGIRKLDALFGKKLSERFAGKRGAATRATPAPLPKTVEQELAENPPTEAESDIPF